MILEEKLIYKLKILIILVGTVTDLINGLGIVTENENWFWEVNSILSAASFEVQ